MPAHLNLAKFLSNSCFSLWKSWMYFIWGHKATAEADRDVNTREQAGRYIPVELSGHPTTPRGTQGLPSPGNGPAEGFQLAQGFSSRVSSLSVHPSSPGKGTAALCALDFSWTTQSESWGPPKPCPGFGISRWADLCSQHLTEPVPVSLARTGRHSRACASTPALNTDPPNGKATIQVQREETDQRTDPTSLHPADPGNQDRKSQGSLTGLTGLNEHLASPVESQIKPFPSRAWALLVLLEELGRAQHTEAHGGKGLADSPPHTFFFSGSSLYFLDRILVRSRLLISG